MPAPIVLSTLTPETKKVVNPPTGQPVIATKAEFRDGSRPPPPPAPPTFTLSSTASTISAVITADNGATSYEIRKDAGAAVAGLTLSGLVEDQVYSIQVRGINSSGAGEWSAAANKAATSNVNADPHDWQTILTRQGADTLGTDDPTLNLDNMLTYQGSFRIPQFKTGDNTFYGLNSWRSIAFKAPDGTNGPNGSVFIASFGYVAELQIPSLSLSTDHTALPAATVLQDWVDVWAKMPSGNLNSANNIGWMHCENGKLYMAPYAGYDTGGNVENLFICNDSANLATATYAGSFQTWVNDKGSRYICTIPAAKQAAFGNRTHLCGTGPQASIVTRTSFGHSLLGINLAEVDATYSSTETIEWAWYSDSNTAIDGFSGTNGEVATYYGMQAWPDGAYNLLDYWSQAVIDTYGVSSGTVSQGLKGFAALPFSSGRPSTLHQFPLPAASLRKHAIQYESVCGCAFIPPGTDSVVFLGYNEGSRYGQGYKTRQIEDEPPANWNGTGGAGYSAYAKTDEDNFLWAMNLNDVAARVNVYDPQYYAYMPFQDPGPFAGAPYLGRVRTINSGSYDSVNAKLYLGLSNMPFNQYEGQAVISVYQVGSGV